MGTGEATIAELADGTLYYKPLPGEKISTSGHGAPACSRDRSGCPSDKVGSSLRAQHRDREFGHALGPD